MVLIPDSEGAMMIYEQGSKSTFAPRCLRSNTLISWLKAKRVIFRLSVSVCTVPLLMPYSTDLIGAESGNPLVPFGEHWLGAFKETEAYTVWDSVTDPVLFDLCEPR